METSKSLFPTFCSWFDMIVLKITFFMLGTWYCIRCLMNFFLIITLFSHPLQFHAHLNCLTHFMNLSMLNIIFDIFQMHCLLVFCKFLTFYPCFSTKCFSIFLACTAISCSSQLFTTLYEFIDVKYHFRYFPDALPLDVS